MRKKMIKKKKKKKKKKEKKKNHSEIISLINLGVVGGMVGRRSF